MLLAKVLAAGYVVFGVFALMVASIRDNRRDMFYGSGREWVGTLRLLHAYVASLSMVACGITGWLWPAAAANLAWTVLGVLVLGKAISVASGGGMKCVRCLVAGIAVALLAAIAITVGRH